MLSPSITPIPFFQFSKIGSRPFLTRKPKIQGYTVPQSGIIDFFISVVGNDTNSGSDMNATPRYVSTNGACVSGTPCSFTPTDGSVPSDYIKVGDAVSVMVDGAAIAAVIGIVTTIQAGPNGTLTMQPAGSPGTAGTAFPATSGTARTLKAGGAFKSFSAHNIYGWSRVGNAFTPNKRVRMNVRNDQTYIFGGDYIANTLEPDICQGFYQAPGDGGKATLDWGLTQGGSGFLRHTSDQNNVWADFIITCNATANLEQGIVAGSQRIYWRIVIQHMRGYAVDASNNANCTFLECEFWDCNRSNIVSGMVNTTGNTNFIRCYFHDTTVANGNGIIAGGTFNTSLGTVDGCIFDNLSGAGIVVFNTPGDTHLRIRNCEFYNLTGAGILFNAADALAYSAIVESCNFVKLRGVAISNTVSANKVSGLILNCGYVDCGAGYNSGVDGMMEQGRVLYPSGTTPYNSPTTGDFSLVNPLAFNVGRGGFTETAPKSGTVGYPDIGAAQAQSQAPVTTIIDPGIGGVGGG